MEEEIKYEQVEKSHTGMHGGQDYDDYYAMYYYQDTITETHLTTRETQLEEIMRGEQSQQLTTFRTNSTTIQDQQNLYTSYESTPANAQRVERIESMHKQQNNQDEVIRKQQKK